MVGTHLVSATVGDAIRNLAPAHSHQVTVDHEPRHSVDVGLEEIEVLEHPEGLAHQEGVHYLHLVHHAQRVFVPNEALAHHSGNVQHDFILISLHHVKARVCAVATMRSASARAPIVPTTVEFIAVCLFPLIDVEIVVDVVNFYLDVFSVRIPAKNDEIILARVVHIFQFDVDNLKLFPHFCYELALISITKRHIYLVTAAVSVCEKSYFA